MTKDERNNIRQDAADNHNGDLQAAACTFLDAAVEYKKANGIPAGYEAAVGGIVWEVEKRGDIDVPAGQESSGTTRAKLK